jgi:hypothetical protein
MTNLLRDFQDTLLTERLAAAARKRAPKKAPTKVPSKPVILDVVKREGVALNYLRENILSAIGTLEGGVEDAEDHIKLLEKERREDKAEAEAHGKKLPVSDSEFEKSIEKRRYPDLSIVYDVYSSLYKGFDYLADTLETNEQVTRETELTKVVRDFSKLLNNEKDPKDDPKAASEAIGLLSRVKTDLPDRLTSPSTLGGFRDCCKLIADAINAISKNNLKAPKIPNALDEENPMQLGFGFNARHYIRLAMAMEAAGYDYRVTDPNYLPRPLSTRYVKELKARIGRGTKIKVLKSETTFPRGWDYGNYTVLEITPPGDTEAIKAALTLNIALDECSAIAVLDRPYGTIPVPRSSKPEQVLTWLLSEVGDLLNRSPKTAREYVQAALSQNK